MSTSKTLSALTSRVLRATCGAVSACRSVKTNRVRTSPSEHVEPKPDIKIASISEFADAIVKSPVTAAHMIANPSR